MKRIVPASNAYAIAAIVQLLGCSGGGEAAPEPGAENLAATSTAAAFDPTGQYFVHTDGMTLVLRKAGDPRVFHLTKTPPAPEAGDNGGKPEPAKPVSGAGEAKCVPAAPGEALPGPQEGWPGHPAWSPDGRFIAFVAPWKDGDCVDSNDGDFDVWVVDVTGFDLDKWVIEVVEEASEGKKASSTWFVVGPDGAGLDFYQVTSAQGPEWDPSWSTCRALAWRTDAGILRKEIGYIPGICTSPDEERKLLEAKIEECKKRLGDVEDDLADLQKVHAESTAAATGAPVPPAPAGGAAGPAPKSPVPATAPAPVP